MFYTFKCIRDGLFTLINGDKNVSIFSINCKCKIISMVLIVFALTLSNCMPEAPAPKNRAKNESPSAADILSEITVPASDDSLVSEAGINTVSSLPDPNQAEDVVRDILEEESAHNQEASPIAEMENEEMQDVANDDNNALAALMLRYSPLLEIANSNRFLPQPPVPDEYEISPDLIRDMVTDVYDSIADQQSSEVLLLQEEVSELREELRQLGESLDIYLGAIMADLREENHVLRQEMRRLYAREDDGAPIILPDVPRPHGGLIDDILYQEETEYAAALELQAAAEAAPPPFRFDVLEEWGRSPEDALLVGDGVASLKGIIGVIPAGSLREDIEALAFSLRAQYDEHDNINIEIFDDPVAARQFSDRGATDPTRRIISISKYKNSGRDVIIYFENGEPSEISQSS